MCLVRPNTSFISCLPLSGSVLILLVISGLCCGVWMATSCSIAVQLHLNPSVPWRPLCHLPSWLLTNIENLGFNSGCPDLRFQNPLGPLGTKTPRVSSYFLFLFPSPSRHLPHHNAGPHLFSTLLWDLPASRLLQFMQRDLCKLGLATHLLKILRSPFFALRIRSVLRSMAPAWATK